MISVFIFMKLTFIHDESLKVVNVELLLLNLQIYY